jgi:hypothetical protein
MRKNYKAVLIGLLVVLAVSVAASASASAAECPGTGSGVVLCSGGHVLEGTIPFTGKKKPGSGSEYEVEGVMKIVCTGSTSKGNYVATKTGVEVTDLVIENPGCSLSGHPTCTVKPLVFGLGSGLKGALASPEQITLSAMGEASFSEISVTGCEQAYTKKVTGTQKCSLPKSTTEAAKHEVVCEVPGGELFAGTKKVHIAFTEEIALASGKQFSLQKS